MSRQCLIDADIISYECGFAGQYKDERTGELLMRDFDSVEDMLLMKIREITEDCMSNEEPVLFLTGDAKLARHLNRGPRWSKPLEQIELLPSFRFAEAKTKVYKGQRHADKPLHYDNIRAYMLSNFNVNVSNGLEADDMLAIELVKNKEAILCSLDKDLRQVPGLHYSWSIGKRSAIPVYEVDELGEMKLGGKPKKLFGTGLKNFFAQVLMGDAVDNIQGIPKFGLVSAYNLLDPCKNEMELFLATARTYRNAFPETWEDMLREHVDLVYMIRELDQGGVAVRYKYPEGCELLVDQPES